MNSVTYTKIFSAADKLWKIHENSEQYHFVIDLLDEPFKLALSIMKYPELSDYECAQSIGVNWQTVTQIRRALGIKSFLV